jgi:hypothetical protein
MAEPSPDKIVIGAIGPLIATVMAWRRNHLHRNIGGLTRFCSPP